MFYMETVCVYDVPTTKFRMISSVVHKFARRPKSKYDIAAGVYY
jgi:hypothetical protein